MNIVSTSQFSAHLLINLMNYCVDKEDPLMDEYGFAYFNFSSIQDAILKIVDNWNKEGLEHGKVCVNINQQLKLFKSNEVIEATHDEKLGFEYVKLDSITYLKNIPSNEASEVLSLAGWIVCSRDYFVVEGDLIKDELYYSSIIYRSPRIEYSKIKF